VALQKLFLTSKFSYLLFFQASQEPLNTHYNPWLQAFGNFQRSFVKYLTIKELAVHGRFFDQFSLSKMLLAIGGLQNMTVGVILCDALWLDEWNLHIQSYGEKVVVGLGCPLPLFLLFPRAECFV
jgi:hypothetical protein